MPQPSALRRPHRAHAAEPAPQAALGGTDAKTPALAAIRPSQPAPWRGARRTQALAGLLHMWPWELQDQSPEAARRLHARLARHLIAERKRGIAGRVVDPEEQPPPGDGAVTHRRHGLGHPPIRRGELEAE